MAVDTRTDADAGRKAEAEPRRARRVITDLNMVLSSFLRTRATFYICLCKVRKTRLYGLKTKETADVAALPRACIPK
jgi:hypothetical protein